MISTADCTCVVGLQWGDEAKGKIVDLIGDEYQFVVRYNGGANAGHTVVWGKQTFKLSLLPTGILKPHVQSVIGNGVVIFPPRLLEEVEQLRAAGVEVGENLAVSNHAHVIFPYHMEEDRLNDGGSSAAIGTTGRGIGPCYSDKLNRNNGIRMEDLLHPQILREKLRSIVPRKNQMLKVLATGPETLRQFDAERIAEEYLKYADLLAPHIMNTTALLQRGLGEGKKILFEAAQGSLLDVDHGSYPYVTSSNSLPGGIWNGTGIPTRDLGRVIGVIKAYTTRVGGGPFPTELKDDTGERIRKIGREYGTVTGRPRRVGWFDAVAVRYTASLSGVDAMSLMLLDVLSGLPELKICTGYSYNGEPIQGFPSDSYFLERCQPIYETLPGWQEDVTGVRTLAGLPAAARRYLDRVAEVVGVPLWLTSVGPDRDQTIYLK